MSEEDVLAGDPTFIRALLAFVAGDVACDKESTVSGGTDVVVCTEQATTMAVRGVVAPHPHVHYHFGCDRHAPGLIGAIHAERDGLFFELDRTDHDDSCELAEVEVEEDDA